MEQNHTPFTPEAATDEPASPVLLTGEAQAYPFNPVPVRYRHDGWTPAQVGSTRFGRDVSALSSPSPAGRIRGFFVQGT